MGQGCQVESKSNRILLSNQMFFAEIKLNQMQIESNYFFDFGYDSIRSGRKFKQESSELCR
jgi:hypothetical protein